MSLETNKWWQLFLFSATGSCVADAATIPVDVLKVRLQLQGELGAAPKYNSAWHAARTMVAEEGVLSLFKGLKPALLRQSTYGSMRIGLYEPIKSKLIATFGVADAKDPPVWVKAVAGVTSGALASGICTPSDVVKVRMQADVTTAGKASRYRGLIHAFRDIYAHEGAKGLYKGVTPTTQRAAVVAMVELATYDEVKQLLVRVFNRSEDSVVTHFQASFVAGFCTTLASSPLDVVKSRLMNQPVDEHGRGTRYRSTLDCFRQSITAEGVRGLYKGFWPNFGRIGPHSVITFLVIEQLRGLMKQWDL